MLPAAFISIHIINDIKSYTFWQLISCTFASVCVNPYVHWMEDFDVFWTQSITLLEDWRESFKFICNSCLAGAGLRNSCFCWNLPVWLKCSILWQHDVLMCYFLVFLLAPNSKNKNSRSVRNVSELVRTLLWTVTRGHGYRSPKAGGYFVTLHSQMSHAFHCRRESLF
jgi:hypothetical protein